ncbi:MAG: hypothetical protein EZS28_010893 [Streblomastix strix]|uniref:Uncharacterized protein n=1 Tax=Streblomastix strix TaxID=222440 RepID=A0A5J4WFB9_9EUKA|nr:MAG: hypothetical protein EZS28_010893 [Streblomastix strix]
MPSALRVRGVVILFSKCLSHNLAVSLKSLRQVLRDSDFNGTNKIANISLRFYDQKPYKLLMNLNYLKLKAKMLKFFIKKREDGRCPNYQEFV